MFSALGVEHPHHAQPHLRRHSRARTKSAPMGLEALGSASHLPKIPAWHRLGFSSNLSALGSHEWLTGQSQHNQGVWNDTAQETIPQIPLGMNPEVLTVRHQLTYIQHGEAELYNVPFDTWSTKIWRIYPRSHIKSKLKQTIDFLHIPVCLTRHFRQDSAPTVESHPRMSTVKWCLFAQRTIKA